MRGLRKYGGQIPRLVPSFPMTLPYNLIQTPEDQTKEVETATQRDLTDA